MKLEINRTDIVFMMMAAGLCGAGLALVVSIVLC